MTVTWKPGILSSVLLIAALLGGCAGDEADFEECDAPSETALQALPTSLSEAGLFSNMATEVLAPGVLPFEPQFKLWSDGAAKRRWIFIPPGAAIDTSDMNQWRFPMGTKLFKEFTRDGVRVETRILMKTGLDDESWSGSAYIWNFSSKCLSYSFNLFFISNRR